MASQYRKMHAEAVAEAREHRRRADALDILRIEWLLFLEATGQTSRFIQFLCGQRGVDLSETATSIEQVAFAAKCEPWFSIQSLSRGAAGSDSNGGSDA